MKLATWNINSVRLRLPIVLRFLEDVAPDVLCLQETKCPNAQFPEKDFRKAGYEHILANGQSGYHGVAIISRLPFADTGKREFCGKGDARHASATIDARDGPLTVHNFYVPAGGDEPDPEKNEKFDHKLRFLDEMRGWFEGAANEHDDAMVLVGDLNIAPLETDVWSHKQLLKVVSHTPVEVDRLAAVQASRGWVDVVRQHIPADEHLYTWWSYRARDWRASNKGRRLDHIWTTPGLNGACKSVDVLIDARDWQKPSDHVPITAVFDI